ncbi:hypothetical protein [Dactylosporangium darangshiense]|uniref:Uncharacterized protein n=1 Tax=Dactylosporangium darangshiense TaxID=579108 RepID=A0ABP8DJ64_9ACTN
MQRKRFGRSVVAALFGLLVAVLIAAPAAVVTVASPAFAAGQGCCDVGIDDLPTQFAAGGGPAPFTVRLVNQSQETLRYVDVSFVLQANGLVGDLVDLQRQRMSGGPHDVGTFTQRGVRSGAVTATEQVDLGALALPPGGGASITYGLSFSRKLPSTALTLSVQVQPRRDPKGVSSAGPYQSAIVAAGQPIQTQPAATPTLSPAGDAPASAAGAAPIDRSPAAAAGASGGGGSLSWLAYTIGALLLLGGMGAIGTLVWRRRPHPHAPVQITAYDVPGQAGGPGVHGLHTAPTAQYPIAQQRLEQ